MNRRVNMVSVAFLAMVLAACSGLGEPQESGKTVDELLAESNLRITEEANHLVNFNIRGWQYVNRQNVVLEDGPRTRYLVELTSTCPNLQFAQRIGFTSYGRMVRKSDYIVVTDAPGRIERCMIRTFYKLEEIPER